MILLPESFEKRMKSVLGKEFTAFSQALSNKLFHSIRINPKKLDLTPDLEPVLSCSTGYYLTQRPIYTLDPLFHAGVYYVQESSSMFLEQFLRQSGKTQLKVLDLCAAPGGKSTHLTSLLPDDSLLVCNEVIHSRAQVLSENLKKWGNPNVIVTCNDPKDFARLPGFFDVIVVDAPCSGEGLFRRDPSAIEEWSEEQAAHCALRQKRILADVWPSLAEGGLLIYSTCTYNPAENEENIKWLSEFAQTEPQKLEIPEEWGVVTTEANGYPCYRFYPHLVKGEGFFTAAVKKMERCEPERKQKNKTSLPLAGKTDLALIGELVSSLSLAILNFEGNFLAFPTCWLTELDQIKANLRIVHAGVKICEIKQGNLIPAHELAVSTIVNGLPYPTVELTLEQSLRFLKREEFQPNFQETGWNLFTYRSHPIGWAKNIGNRFNNGYPKEWRIRMSTTDFTGERLVDEAGKFPIGRLEI